MHFLLSKDILSTIWFNIQKKEQINAAFLYDFKGEIKCCEPYMPAYL